jgi:hypothetical protein
VTRQATKPELNWMQTAGSALAALSSAALLSTLGATGTLVGAAVGSIVVTVGGTVYSHYLSVSRERMAARSAAVRPATRHRGRSGDASMGAVTRTLGQSPERFPLLAESAKGAAPTGTVAQPPPGRRLIDGNLPGTPTSLRQMLRGLRWKPALAASLGVFVLVMGLIVSMELATGRALSSYTGGSSADGPRTSIALLGSTSTDTRDDSPTSDPADSGLEKSSGDTADSGTQGTGDGAGRSTAESGSDSDAPPSDTSTPDPDIAPSTEPSPEPTAETPTEPAPEPTPAPTTQEPAQAPAPSAGSAAAGAVADTVS